MNCDAYRILISAYIDGELSDSDAQCLKAHLTSCTPCFLCLQEQEKMQAAIKRYTFMQEVPGVPETFSAKIIAQLENELQQLPSLSYTERLAARCRADVRKFVDAWIGSLKLRPFTWTVSAGFFFLSFSALLMNEFYLQPSGSYLAEPQTPDFEMASREESFSKTVKQFEETALAGADREFDGSDFIVIAELDNESAPLPTLQNCDPMQDYVYSHVVEAYQDRLSEDAMLIGYVQKAHFLQ
ncbi:hypothetical protein CSA57_11015 [candidate division KSB3 bacterium]|nr:MAG: hypothetical protein CSA57_11015 [candidate division KSB3 bacterium]